MSTKVFEDNVFPRHVSDLMNLLHMVVFNGTDGEEKWETFLNLKQKEYVALSLGQYYQCEHCIKHHLAALCKLERHSQTSIYQNVSSMILFLRIDTRTIGKAEKEHWIKAWQRFAYTISKEHEDEALPFLIGLAIGVARNDEFLIHFCGKEVREIFSARDIDVRAVVGELEAVVTFMKAATSKNRIIDKVADIFQ